jgi:hypothetical protein
MSAEDSHGCVRIVVFDMGGVLTNDVVEPLRDHLIKTFSLSPERADQLRSFCKQHWNQMKVRSSFFDFPAFVLLLAAVG